jgi:hypothetical protein
MSFDHCANSLARPPPDGTELMRFALVLALMAASAAQETESITVNASALVGVWKITRPTYVAKRGIFAAIEFGPPLPGFCRIEQSKDELAVHCLAHGSGTARLDGPNIHFARGGMIARIVIDGVLQADKSFAGHEVFKLAGITIADTNLSSGAKLDLSTPQSGPPDSLLRGAIANGLRQTPHDIAVKDSPALTVDLGAVQAVVWLGYQDKFAPPGQPNIKDYFSVYAVEFDHGERICGLHRRADGVLDAFQCI